MSYDIRITGMDRERKRTQGDGQITRDNKMNATKAGLPNRPGFWQLRSAAADLRLGASVVSIRSAGKP